mmetsp:Transcript_16123/g.15843  ORF Transcript_16123/g.15843 Transcript_16123/m.15843 type:complete len:98 (-) Transcript_16123:20-313(-)
MFRVYSLIFGLLLFLSEFKLDFIKKYFYFLRNTLGKGCFCLLMATTLLSSETWGLGLAIAYTVFGICFIIFSFFEKKDDDSIYKEAQTQEPTRRSIF